MRLILRFFQRIISPPARRSAMTIQAIAPGSRAECCATCRYSRLWFCEVAGADMPADLTAGVCAAWDLEPWHAPVQKHYIQLMAAGGH